MATEDRFQFAEVNEWKDLTLELLKEHPLKPGEIRDIATESWVELWKTSIGSGKSAIPLTTISLPATVIGYFFKSCLFEI